MEICIQYTDLHRLIRIIIAVKQKPQEASTYRPEGAPKHRALPQEKKNSHSKSHIKDTSIMSPTGRYQTNFHRFKDVRHSFHSFFFPPAPQAKIYMERKATKQQPSAPWYHSESLFCPLPPPLPPTRYEVDRQGEKRIGKALLIHLQQSRKGRSGWSSAIDRSYGNNDPSS